MGRMGRMHRRLLKRLGKSQAGAISDCPSCEAFSWEGYHEFARQVSALLRLSRNVVGKGRVCVEGLRRGDGFVVMESGVRWPQQSTPDSLRCTASSSQKYPPNQVPACSNHPLNQLSTLRFPSVFVAADFTSRVRNFSTTNPPMGACHLAPPSVSTTPPVTPPFHRSVTNADDATSHCRSRIATSTGAQLGDASFSTRGAIRQISTQPEKSSLGSWFSSLWGASPERTAVSPTEAPAVAHMDTPGVSNPAVATSGAPAVSDQTEGPTRATEPTKTELHLQPDAKPRIIEIWWDRRRKARVPILTHKRPSSSETPGLGNRSKGVGSELGKKWRGRNGRGKRMEGHVLGKHEHGLRDDQVPETAWFVLRRLRKAGYDGYLAGGVVRDLLLGRTPKDVDIVTSASPNQVKRAVPRTMVIGRRFQIARVTVNGSEIEVSSFGTLPRPLRTVGASPGPRADASREKLLASLRAEIPEGVRHLAASALKRDVTINSLLYDPFKLVLYDFCGGMDDLARKKIRTIIDPEESFAEDPARILRAIRIAARTGFSLTPEVARAATKVGDTALPALDRSRSQMELAVMMGYGAAERSVRLLWRTGLLKYLLPLQAEYFAAKNFPPSAGSDRGDLLLDLLRRLDSFTTAVAPCHSALWVALLALHLAAHQLNPGPLVILTLVKAMTKDSVENGVRHGFNDAHTHLLLTTDDALAAARRELQEYLSTERNGLGSNGTERIEISRELMKRMKPEWGERLKERNVAESGGTESIGTEHSGTESGGATGNGTEGDGTEGLPTWAEEYVANHVARQKLFVETVKPGAERLAERAAAIVHQMALPDGPAARAAASGAAAITRADAARASALFALVANRSSPEVAAYCALVRQSRKTRWETQGRPPNRGVLVANADLKAGRIEDLADAICLIVGKVVAPVPRRDVEGEAEGDD